MWNVSLLRQLNANPLWFTLAWTYFVELFISKLALLSLYWRIFGPMRNVRVAIWVTTIWITAVMLVGVVGVAATCRSYDKWLLLERLPKTLKIWVASSAMNLISDVLLLAIPLYAIGKLQLSRSRKIAISSVFGTGIM